MIRAAALSYAIVFSLLTGLICSGVLFIASSQKKIEVIHNNKERVLFDSYSAIQYGIRNVAANDSAQLIFKNGDTSKVSRKQWGAFSLVTSETFKGNLRKLRSAMIGVESRSLPVLYLAGNSGGLKITGNTKIEGTAFIPNAAVERAYVGGRNYVFDQLIFGEKKTAELSLPALRKEWSNINAQTFTAGLKKFQEIPGDSVFSFHFPTTCYENMSGIVLSGKLAGNVIIHSFDSIYVSSEAKLDNVILIAPIIHFAEGFTGSAQVIAHERITCDKRVKLLYPSVLLLNELSMNNPLSRRHIFIDEEAIVLGGILITSQQYDFRKPPFLEIRKDATIAGLIYNTGETELFGNVAGSLYTGTLLARVGGGSYGNHLVDAIISKKELPKDFLLPVWLEDQTESNQKILKWL